MGLNDSQTRHIGTISGILAIIAFIAFTATAIMLFPGHFSQFDNYISDLGNSGLNPAGAKIFDAGAILTGAFTIIFFTGLYVWRLNGQWQLTIARLLGAFAGFALILVGIFSEDYGKVHTIVATVFFISLIVAIIATDFVLGRHRQFLKFISYYGVLVALFSLIYIGSYLLDIPVIIAEWITVLGALGWMGLLAYNTLKITCNGTVTTKKE